MKDKKPEVKETAVQKDIFPETKPPEKRFKEVPVCKFTARKVEELILILKKNAQFWSQEAALKHFKDFMEGK